MRSWGPFVFANSSSADAQPLHSPATAAELQGAATPSSLFHDGMRHPFAAVDVNVLTQVTEWKCSAAGPHSVVSVEPQQVVMTGGGARRERRSRRSLSSPLSVQHQRANDTQQLLPAYHGSRLVGAGNREQPLLLLPTSCDPFWGPVRCPILP